MTTKKIKWSKTKIGALLVGFGVILGTVGGMFQGSIELGVGIQALMVQIGVVTGVFGLRDLPFINKK